MEHQSFSKELYAIRHEVRIVKSYFNLIILKEKHET